MQGLPEIKEAQHGTLHSLEQCCGMACRDSPSRAQQMDRWMDRTGGILQRHYLWATPAREASDALVGGGENVSLGTGVEPSRRRDRGHVLVPLGQEPCQALGHMQTHPVTLLAFGASWSWDAQTRGTLDVKRCSLELGHRHHEPRGAVPLFLPSPGSTHTGTFISRITLGARRSFWSWEASVTLEQTKWHYQPPQTTPVSPTAGADRHLLRSMPSCAVLLSPCSCPGSASTGLGSTAKAGLPSLLQHQPHWEPNREAETMLHAAHSSLSWGWACQAASLTGLPGGPGSPCGEMDIIASPFPRSSLSPCWGPSLPSPSPLGAQLVLELPVAREEMLGGGSAWGGTPGTWQPHHSQGARSTALWPLPQLTSLPDGPGRPGAPASP